MAYENGHFVSAGNTHRLAQGDAKKDPSDSLQVHRVFDVECVEHDQNQDWSELNK